MAAVPAFAQQAPAATAPTPEETTAAPVISDAMPLPDRRMLFAGDVSRLFGVRAAAAAEPAVESRSETLLKRALALLGTPYRWGGTSTAGFDCSGLVGYVFRSAMGIELPRVSREMASSGTPVDRDSLTPGDLVFFSLHGRHRVDHVGIYMGEGRFLHAPSRGKVVRVDSLSSSYWSGRYLEGRRVAM